MELLRELNKTGTRKVPDDAPCGFIRSRWERHVFTSEGIDRRFSVTCVLSELGKSLRAGDLSVASSRRYRDFDNYLLPAPAFAAIRTAGWPPRAMPKNIWCNGQSFFTPSFCAWTASLMPKNCRKPP